MGPTPFFHTQVYFPSTVCLKPYPFSTEGSWHPVKNHLAIYVRLIPGLCVPFNWSICLPVSNTTLFWVLHLCSKFDKNSGIFKFTLFQDGLGFLLGGGPLKFHVNFGMGFGIFAKTTLGFWQIALTLQIILGSINNLTILKSSNVFPRMHAF